MRADSFTDLAVVFVVSATGLYVFLRWLLGPLTQRLPAGVCLFADVVGALLLIPEYACTTIFRRTIGHPPPLAFTYGEMVSALACTLHASGLVATDALRTASVQVAPVHALIGALAGALCLVLLA